MQISNKPTIQILLQGFDAFDDFDRNPADPVVKALHGLLMQEESCNIVTHTFPYAVKSEFQDIDHNVPLMHEFNFDCIIHFGVSIADALAIESQACKSGYTWLDNSGKRALGQSVAVQAPRGKDLPYILKTSLDTRTIVDKMKAKKYLIDYSEDPGNRCCGYTYYTSLAYRHIADGPKPHVLFVHVPPLPNEAPPQDPNNRYDTRPYTVEQLIRITKDIVREVGLQVAERKE